MDVKSLLKIVAYADLETVKKYMTRICLTPSESYAILSESAYNTNVDVFMYLITKGASLESCTEHCIDNAIDGGNIEILSYIHKAGYKFYDLSCAFASARGNVDILQFLYQTVGINIKKYSYLCLSASIEHHNIDITRKLFYMFGCVLPIDETQQLSLFLMAVQDSLFEIAEYLIWKGIPVKYLNSRRIYPNIRDECIRYLNLKSRAEYRASKIIYFWWIQICHNPSRICGNRIVQKKYEEYRTLYGNIIK